MRFCIVSVCFWLLLSLTGCVNTPVAVDGAGLTPSQGLLVLKIDANVDGRLGFLDYSSVSTFGSRWKEYMVGPKGFVHAKAGQTNYVIIPLDAGDYMWSTLEVASKYAPLQSSNRFRVVAGSITYIGDINLHSYGMTFTLKATDGAAAMHDYLSKNYPAYMTSMPIVTTLAELRL